MKVRLEKCKTDVAVSVKIKLSSFVYLVCLLKQTPYSDSSCLCFTTCNTTAVRETGLGSGSRKHIVLVYNTEPTVWAFQ